MCHFHRLFAASVASLLLATVILLFPVAQSPAQAGVVGKSLGEAGMNEQVQNLGDTLRSELSALATKGRAVRGASGALEELTVNSGELICNAWLISFRVDIRNMIIENAVLSGEEQIRHTQVIKKMREFVEKLELECTRVGLIGDGGPTGGGGESEEDDAEEDSSEEDEPEEEWKITPLPGETIADAICRHRCQGEYDNMKVWEDSEKKAEARAQKANEDAAKAQKTVSKLESDLAESEKRAAKAKRITRRGISGDSTFAERQAVIKAGRDLSLAENEVKRYTRDLKFARKALKKAKAEAASWREHAKWMKRHADEARQAYYDCLKRCIAQAKAAGEKTTLTCPDDYPCLEKKGATSKPVKGGKNEPKSSKTAYACPMPPAHLAVVVGANDKIGSGARLKNKAKEAFGGGFGVGGGGGSSVGGGFGQGRSTFGGGGGRPALGPKPDLDDDPIDDDDKVTQEVQGVELATGAVWTNEGLLVSINIEDSPGDGTFQSVFLEDYEGRRRAPDEIRLYGLWHEWQLTVTWTYREWVDNELVKEESGGWSDDGRSVYVASSLTEGLAQDAGLWKLMGFETANKGLRSIGVLFKIKKEDFVMPMDVVVHTTLPEKSPVTTVPIVGRLFRKGAKNDDRNLDVLIEPTLVTIAQENGCY
ncbi:hypothetical protein [Pelagibius sp. Alg239-R121]|uniref:hypothetical protein n=1 Tax=Pelagibius sp. Alg239-R121 TaxID=2993448 RepID=UPI0024A78AC5|nr:hypothetical protein [Pelagibius sp. Alg239-R121]